MGEVGGDLGAVRGDAGELPRIGVEDGFAAVRERGGEVAVLQPGEAAGRGLQAGVVGVEVPQVAQVVDGLPVAEIAEIAEVAEVAEVAGGLRRQVGVDVAQVAEVPDVVPAVQTPRGCRGSPW